MAHSYPLIVLSIVSCFLRASDHDQALREAEEFFYQGQFTQAQRVYDQLLAADPANAELLCNKALILQKMCQFSAAEKIYHELLSYNPTYGRALRGLSHVLLMRGDFARGWPLYEFRWKNPPIFNQELKNYIKQGNSLIGKRVLIHTEYGLGDTLQFIRYALELKKYGAFVVLACQRPLIPLLKLLPYIDWVIPQELECTCDFQVMLMSLPWIFSSDDATIPRTMPYLYADPTLIKKWGQRLNHRACNVGICWHTVSPTPDAIVRFNAQARSIPFEQIAPLTATEGINFWCLQKINDTETRSLLAAHHINLLDEDADGPATGAFMDTAALIKNLDLVITIDTAITHLAGGLGIKTWLLLPYSPDWRWMLDRRDTPWYPSMTLYRHTADSNWTIPLCMLANDLAYFVRQHQSPCQS